MSTTDTTPTPDPVEDRLRATLAAEAVRHPVTPDFAGLRARADRTVIDLTLPPRRNRVRVVAAAAVLALLAGAVGGAVAIRASDDDGEPVIADQPTPTGYYLPGEGWEVHEIFAYPMPTMPGTARIVELGEISDEVPTAEDDVLDSSNATVFVSRLTDEDPDLAALAEGVGWSQVRTVDRGSGDTAREYVIAPLSALVGDDESEVVDPASIDVDGGSLMAAVDGLLLSVDFYGPIGEQAMVELADRWWESGGEAVVVDPATGMTRMSDVTYPGAEPATVDDILHLTRIDDDVSIEDLYGDASIQVIVQVQAPDGWSAAYTLAAPGQAVPTGAGDPEAGRAAGLTPEEVGAALPPEVGGPQPAWEGAGGITAEVPGASLGVNTTSFVVERRLTAEHARELWAALRPVSHDVWTDASQATLDVGLPEGVWGETLAETDAASFLEVEESSSSSGSDSGEGFAGEGTPLYEPVELLPRDGTNPAAGRTPEEVDQVVADAVLAFVGGSGPVDADLFAPTVDFAYDDGSETTTAAIEDVAVADLPGADGSLDAALEARNLLDTITPADMTELVGPDGGCEPVAELSARDDVVVLLQDSSEELGREPCTEWAALLVFLDAEQRITRVEARFSPIG